MVTPNMYDARLFLTSGHYQNYKAYDSIRAPIVTLDSLDIYIYRIARFYGDYRGKTAAMAFEP